MITILCFLIGLIIGNLLMTIFLDSEKFKPIKKRNEEMKKEIEELKRRYANDK